MVDMITAAMGAKMASGAVQSQIDTALSSVYKYKGQCTNSELASKTKTAGDVWEITDTGTYVAGTDVVCDGTNWSAMSGHLHVNVVDSLDSTSSQGALSANMGKALADGKQDKLTAGTGISISEQNVISASGGGGTWTLRTANTDWTDIFEGTGIGNTVKSKEEMIIVIYSVTYYVPKGKSYSNGLSITFSYSGGTTNKIYVSKRFTIKASELQSSNTFSAQENGAQLTIVDGDIVASAFSDNVSLNKNDIDVYIKN